MEKNSLLKEYGVEVDTALEFWGDFDSYMDNLKEFNDTLDEKINNLEYYKNNKDTENYGILAHSIKSECKYLGFIKDAQVFLNHEMAGKNNDLEYINANFQNIIDVKNNIKKLLNSCFLEEKKNILVADDSNIIINYIENNIKNEFNVLRATNGNMAIEALDNNSIYAILLDLNMPSMNGFEVLEYLKSHKLLEIIPVIIITGDDTKETISKAFSYPILDVLNKPFSDDNIRRVLISIKSFHEKK